MKGILLAGLLLAGCGGAEEPQATPAAAPPAGSFRSHGCNGVTDEDVTKAAESTGFKKVLDSDAGCFWQEDTMLGAFGAGMGISTWWYRGSDMDVEREIEQQTGRTITEMSIDGNKGFKAADTHACSVYVAKGGDVITWSIQTMNPDMLPDLCSITERLAQLSQQRVN